MWYLVESLWYSLVLVFKVIWIPVSIILVLGLIAKIYGIIKGSIKNRKK